MAIKWWKRKNTPLGGLGGLASHNAGCNSKHVCSSAYRTLPSVVNHHYLDKVRVIGLEVGDDRYADDGRFVDDVTLWPPV